MKNQSIKIALYSSNGFQETFTKAHKDLLKVDYLITEGTPPRMVNGIPMLPMDKWNVLIRKLNRLFGKKITPLDPLNYFLNHNKVDVFIAEFGMAGAAIFKACKERNIPLIVNFYGIDAFGNNYIKKYGELYTEMFEYASLISVQSESIKRQLIHLNCSEEKLVVNTAPPAEKFYNLSPDLIEPILISVGRFVEKKAPDLVVKCFNEILKFIPNAKLIMIGDGELMESVIVLAKSLNIYEKIDFIGRVNPDEQINLMLKASIFIQHSVVAKDGDAEGIPVAIMEASAMGLPVVSTFHSGIPEVIEHELSGYLVKEGEYKEMANFCIQLLNSKELRLKMGKAGKEIINSKYSMKRHIESINQYIDKVT